MTLSTYFSPEIRSTQRNRGTVYILGGLSQLSEAVPSKIIAARMNMAVCIGQLIATVAHDQSATAVSDAVLGLLLTHFLPSLTTAQSALTVEMICVCLSTWWSTLRPLGLSEAAVNASFMGNPKVQQLLAGCLQVLENDMKIMQDLKPLFMRMRKAAKTIVETYKGLGLPLAEYKNLSPENATTSDCVTIYEKSSAWTTLLGLQLAKADQVFDVYERHRMDLGRCIDQMNDNLELLQRRVTAAAAGAIIAGGLLPVKMAAVVKPLLNTLEKEKEGLLQHYAAASLAGFLALCSNPKTKTAILKNIIALLMQQSDSPVPKDCLEAIASTDLQSEELAVLWTVALARTAERKALLSGRVKRSYAVRQ